MVTRLSYDIIARDRASQTFDKVGRSVGGAGDKFRRAGQDIDRAGKATDDAGAKASGAGTKFRQAGADLDRAGTQAKSAGANFRQAGSDVDGLADKFKNLAKRGVAAAGVAAGAALGKGLMDGLDISAANDKLAAQLGSNKQQARRLGKVSADLYAGAWGDSMDQVNQAVGGVVSSIGGMRKASQKDVKAISASVLDMAQAFEIDVTRSSQIAGQMIRTRLAKNGRDAVDLLTSSLQRVPAFVREDLLDAIDEYGPFMQTIGLKGEQAMSVLVNGAQKGMYGIDKTGDAIKELTIRATDGSDLTQTAFQAIGANADDMADKLLSGGETGADAFDKIVRGLLAIKDPSDRANTAIKLFGTPMEDLSVREIPKFLKGLVDTEDRLGKVSGASRRFGNTLAGNAKTQIESFKRHVQMNLVDFIGHDVIPAAKDLWKEVGPDVRRFGRTLSQAGEDIAPMVKDTLPILADVLGDVAQAFGKFARVFASLPKPVQTAIVTAAVAGYGAKRLGMGLSSFAVGAGTAATAGTAGTVGASTTAAAAGGGLAAGARRAGVVGLAAFTGYETVRQIQELGEQAPKIDALGKSLQNMAKNGMGRLPGEMEDLHNTVERLTSDAIQHRIERAVGSYDQEAEEVHNLDNAFVQLAQQRGIPAARRAFAEMARSEGLSGEETRALMSLLPGYRRALHNAAAAADEHTKKLLGAKGVGFDLLGLWKRNLIPTTNELADKFDLTTIDAFKLERKLRDTTGTAKQHENQLRQVAKQLGLTREQTDRLINRYGDIPKRVETRAEFLTEQAANARDRFLQATKGKFSDLGNDTYAIMVNGQSGHGRITKADGGYISGPGGPREDKIPAQLSNGEFVVNARSTARNRTLLESINAQKFADGGIAGRVNTKVHLDMSEATAAVKALVKELKASLAGGGDMTAAQVVRGQRAARSQAGSPYDWGGVGPGGFDCSGFQSFVYNSARGLKNPFVREFATSSMGSYHNIAPGKGAYNVGWFTGNPGHTAGTIGGLNVESRGGDGVVVGPRARGAFDPLFNRHGHFTTKAGIRATRMGGGDAPGGDMRGRSPAAARKWARERVPGNQFGALNALWNRESGWHWNADNPNSSAYGIPQALPGSKMAAAGPDWKTNPATQMQWGLHYIKSRYGSPQNAWAHSQATGWYDAGGALKPGVTRAVNNTGKDELVLTHNEIKALSRAFRLTKGMSSKEAKGELNELLKSLRDNLGKGAPLVSRVEKMADGILLSTKSTQELRKTMESAKQAYQDVHSKMRDLQSSASSYYGGALFGEGQGLEAFGNAKQLASGAKAFQRNLRRLHRKGLSDSLLQQIAGSTDFESAAALAGMDPHALKRLNRLNRVQMKAAHEVGRYAGHAVFGDELHHARHRMRQVERRTERHENRLDEHDEKRIERAMRKAMHGAHIKIRDGGRDRDADLLLRTGL